MRVQRRVSAARCCSKSCSTRRECIAAEVAVIATLAPVRGAEAPAGRR
jgi:hypothetical protein